MNKIDLVHDTIDNQDIDQLILWLSKYPKLTKGDQTVEFEKQFAAWIGTKYSVFVNSGSSANLLMVYALKILNKLKNNKVCVPSLCWATDLAPVMQFGLLPLLIDCNMENLSVDLEHMEEVFIAEQPSALILVSVLGLSPDMDKIIDLCKKHDVILLEDNCESLGTSYKHRKLGTFGLASSFSTYFGHTMSTIEGGMITTNDDEMYHALLQLRSHGWDRDLPPENQQQLRKESNVDDFSALYTFYIPGFNVRSTDLQAQLGLQQLQKLDTMVSNRYENFMYYKSKLEGERWFPIIVENTYTASFALPVVCSSTEEKFTMIDEFRNNNIACRPLISGSMGNQPFYTKIYGKCELKNCYTIDKLGIYVSNHDKLTKNDMDRIIEILLKCNYLY